MSGSRFIFIDAEAGIPVRHPVRKIGQVVKTTLATLDGIVKARYTGFGRASIAQVRLVQVRLLPILFGSVLNGI